VQLYPVSWVCVATRYHPYAAVNPPLEQISGRLKEEPRDYFCVDGFQAFRGMWHCNMTCAKLFCLSLGLNEYSRREDVRRGALYLLILRVYFSLQRKPVTAWKIDGCGIAAFVKMPFYDTGFVQIPSEERDRLLLAKLPY